MTHSASKHVTVEHIATEPTSGHQREQAIIAFAILITAWQHDQDQPGADSAALLPLPGSASHTDSIAAAQGSHAAAEEGRRGELAATERQLARTGAAIDRYLTAFENGSLDPEDLARRLAQLKARSGQLRARRDELASELTFVPAPPPAATLRQVAEHIDEIIGAGTRTQRKALIEALVAQVKITGPGRIVPVFRIPQATGAGDRQKRSARCSCNDQFGWSSRVGRLGLEPRTGGL
jgi:site-specific DNA recombinase